MVKGRDENSKSPVEEKEVVRDLQHAAFEAELEAQGRHWGARVTLDTQSLESDECRMRQRLGMIVEAL